MKKNEIFRKIGNIISELNDQYQYLSSNPENLNDLELELFLANSNFLSDHIEILRKLNSVSVPQPQIVPLHTPAPAEVVTPQPLGGVEEKVDSLPAFKFEEAETDSFDYEQKGVDELFDRQLTAEERRIIESKREPVREPEAVLPAAPEPAPEPVRTEPPVINTPVEAVVEKVEQIAVAEVSIPEPPVVKPVEVQPAAKPTINDLISAQVSATTVASRFGQTSASDLKSMISLNDKLLFVKDLFNGYSLAYSEAIELVNRFETFEAADNFLKLNYAEKNNWESKQATVEKFYEILNRRFS